MQCQTAVFPGAGFTNLLWYDEQPMFHDWDLTREEFDRLLAWLHPEQEVAAQKYEDIRRRVRKVMTARGCSAAMEIFDEAVYRITRKLPDLLVDYEGDPALYFYGVANLVHLEYLHEAGVLVCSHHRIELDYRHSIGLKLHNSVLSNLVLWQYFAIVDRFK